MATGTTEKVKAPPAAEPSTRRPTRVRKLNVPLLAGTLIGVAVFGAALWAWRSYQVSRTAGVFLVRAADLEQEENWRDAAAYYHRYLQLKPADDEARVRLAVAYDKSATDTRQSRRLIDLYFQAIGAASEEAGSGQGSSVTSLPPAPARHELRRRVAAILLESGSYAEAAREARIAVEENPIDLESLRLRALALYAQAEMGASDRSADSAGDGSSPMTPGEALDAALHSPDAEMPKPDVFGEYLTKGEVHVQLAPLLAKIYRERPELLGPALGRNGDAELTDAQRNYAADKVMSKMLEGNPESAAAHLTVYGYRKQYVSVAQGQAEPLLPSAEDSLRRAKELGPDDVAVLLTAASDKLEQAAAAELRPESGTDVQELRAKAEAYYQHILGDTPDERAFLGLGEARLAQNNPQGAIEAWEEGLEKANPKSIPLHVRLAATRLVHSDLESASECLNKLDTLVAEIAPRLRQNDRISLRNSVEFLRAHLESASGNVAGSAQRLEQLTASWSKGDSGNVGVQQVWTSLGRAYAARRAWDRAAAAFEESARLAPDNYESAILTAVAWERAGIPQNAIDYFQRALNIQQNANAWIALARAHFRQQTRVEPAKRNWSPFERALTAAERLAGESQLAKRDTLLLRADYWRLQAAGAADPAKREEARKTAVKFVSQVEALAEQDELPMLVRLYELLKRPKDADDVLAKLEASERDPEVKVAARAVLHNLREERDAARKILEEGIAAAAADRRRDLQVLLFQTLHAAGKKDEARDLVVELQKNNPGDEVFAVYLAELALEAKDYEELEDWGAKLGADSSWARYFQARRLLAEPAPADPAKTLQDVLAIHGGLAKQRPAWPPTWIVKGLLEEQRRNAPLAAEAYEKAIACGDHSVWLYQRLAAQLVAANRLVEAESHLNRLVQRGGDSPGLSNLEASLAARLGDWERAAEAAQRIVDEQPNDLMSYIRLGLSRMNAKQPEAAEAAFRDAIAIDETDVRGWNALFSYYLRNNVAEQARETLEQLAGKAKLEKAQRAFILAQGYELLGDNELAAKNYQEAVRLAPKNAAIQMRMAGFHLKTDTNKAQTALERVLELDPENNDARRALAAVLAARGDDSWDSAMKLIDQAGSGENTAEADRRLEVVLLLYRGGKEYVSEAREKAKQLVSGPGVPAVTDQLLYVQACEREAAVSGPSPHRDQLLRDAERQYIALMAEYPQEPRYVAAYIDLLRRQNQGAKAAGWIRQLEAAWLRGEPDWNKQAAYGDFLVRRGFERQAAPALARLEKMLTAEEPLDPVHAAQFIELCLVGEFPSLADPWIKKLEEVDGNSLRYLTSAVRWMVSSKRQMEIAPTIESFAMKALPAAADAKERANLLLQFGNLCLYAKLYSDAQKWYREYVRLNPVAYHMLALAMAKNGELTKAIGLCRQAARDDKSTRPAIATALLLVNSLPDAEAHRLAEPIFAQTLADHGADAELLRTLGDVRLMQGRMKEAADLYQRALKLEPRSVILLNNLAALYAEDAGNLDQAMEYIDTAISIAGPRAAFLDTKGTIALNQRDTKAAVELFEKAAYLGESDARHHFHLAYAYLQVGQAEKAGQAYQKAREQGLTNQLLTETDRRNLAELESRLQ